MTEFNGNVEQAVMRYIIRDFDPVTFVEKQEKLRQAVAQINETYGEGTAEVKIEESYRNMREKDRAVHAADRLRKRGVQRSRRGTGYRPDPRRHRWCTVKLCRSAMSQPGYRRRRLPYLFEHITVEGMDLSVEIIKNIIKKM